MRAGYRKFRFRCVLAVVLAVALALPLTVPAVGAARSSHTVQSAADTAQGDDYRAYLRAQGFPESYVERLYELHLLHPLWQFEALKVTQLNKKYTWSYCLHMETDDNAKRSLISAGSQYAPYRHAVNTERYDSGWYQASAAAVAYFMDPRNFLNEKDIFQFEDLKYRDSVSVSQVEGVLSGTFMANAKLENGRSYAEYFLEVGRELGLNPIHLASRARQEQGAGKSPQISGRAGERLWYYYSNNIQTDESGIVYAPKTGHSESELMGYNGFYNFYNINAAGTGRFAIILGAMKEAVKGTAEMAEKWGGSPSWDTKWKSIYGGAFKLAKSYIGNYQNTLYLQKWNVDFRSKSASGASRNFWGQYMQNIGAALSEARTGYAALGAVDCLDCPFTFVIPVYDGMPDSCPDPADGECEAYARADTKYSSLNRLTVGGVTLEADNACVFAEKQSCAAGGVLSLQGVSYHSSVPEAFEYSLDGGDWVAVSAAHDGTLDVSEAVRERFSGCLEPGVPNVFDVKLPLSSLDSGAHTLTLRGRVRFDSANSAKNNCRYYLVAEVPFEIGNDVLVTVDDGTSERCETVARGGTFRLPDAPAAAKTTEPGMEMYFAGWAVGDADGGDGDERLLPAGGELSVTKAIRVRAVFVSLGMRYGAAARLGETSALRFNGIVGYDGYEELYRLTGGRVSRGLIICKTPQGGLTSLDPAALEKGNIAYLRTVADKWRQSATEHGYYAFCGETGTILPSEFEVSYSAAAYLRVVYADGSERDIVARYSPQFSCRSVAYVMRCAGLAD